MDAQAPRDPGTRRGRRDTPRRLGIAALRLVTLAAYLALALMLATAPPREAPWVGAIGSGCSSLASLDLSGWDTSRVQYMGDMFYGCSSLASLDLPPFDTSQVTQMGCMFYECSSLRSLDLSHFDTSRVQYMGDMFYGCSSLASLDLSGWDTSKVGGMWGMFLGCASLSSLAVGEGCGDVLSADMHTALPAGVGGWGWHSERDKRWLTLNELSSSRQGVADTYTAPGAWRSLVSPQAAQASP